MSQNVTPLLVSLKKGVKSIRLTKANNQIPIADTQLDAIVTCEPSVQHELNLQPLDTNIQLIPNIEETQTVIYQVVYPEDLDLKPTNTKRGRPKRKVPQDTKPPEVPVEPPKSARTRSGRLVKLPKHIEKDFKKIEITDEPEIKTSEFVRFEESNKNDNVVYQELEVHQKKRTISAQYRCPKCQKAYLGKAKMVQHLEKYPDHGPLSDTFNKLNFDVWNYLVDITQKSPPGRRGSKFCEELTNLLHNVQLLTSALFKKEEVDNNVQVDKVLGNAIGLNPGKYRFDENELHKDVTVLKLIGNSDFFNPKNNTNLFNTTEKINENSKSIENVPKINKADTKQIFEAENVKLDENNFFSTEALKASSHIDFRTGILEEFNYQDNSVFKPSLQNLAQPNGFPTFQDKKTGIQTISVEDTTLGTFTKKSGAEVPMLDNQITLHSDLLSENSLLNALPHELMSAVDSSANLLDNSISSDEVMNVDQFVNERFKKITEPDLDLSTGSLNLDLPNLDLFNFHTS